MTTDSPFRREWLPAALVLTGVVVMFACAWPAREALGWWQWGVWLGGLAAAGGALWFQRRLTLEELDLATLRSDIHAKQRQLAVDETQWQAAREAIESQLSEHSERLDSRERALSGKLLTFHEWMEFPQPLDLASHSTPTEQELSALSRQDRQLEELLNVETQRVFEDILSNKYVVEGEFRVKLVRDDLLALVTRVARIYQPDVKEPLLETSMAQVLRSASRVCLQTLVLIEQLPLNVKEYSFASLYGYVRQGVKAYGMMRSSEPYWPYFNSAYYLGRFAMGANPLTLAAWWFLGAWGKEGAKQLATQILHRQAMTMLQSVIRVIGHEVAGMYGGDFRHRDPNWLYAVELTELVHRFPASRESLSHALKEVGALILRHEYDRVYLYRALAAHASAEPERYQGRVLLTAEEKMAIARRLERFLATFIHGQTPDRVAAWRKGVEDRLGVKLSIVARGDQRNLEAQTEEAIRSLASFLLAIKEREPEELEPLLHKSRLFEDLPPAQQAQVLATLMENPPYFFEQPALDPASPLVNKYLDDLASLAAHTAPHEGVIDEVLVDVATYLRFDAKKMRQLLDKKYVALLAERLPSNAPEKRFPPAVARAVLDVAPPQEPPKFVYGSVSFEWPEGTHAPSFPKSQNWLVGIGSRLIVFALGDRPVLLWRADGDCTAERVRGYLAGDVKLRGGTWLGDVRPEQPTLSVAGPLIASHDAYFKPLLAMCTQSQTSI
jgi:hypothetical protein